MVLKVEDLRVGYGKIEVLKGITLEVSQGCITALVGSNGAGKSTTLMAVSGILPLKTGRISLGAKESIKRTAKIAENVIAKGDFLDGQALKRVSPDDMVSRGIVQVPEGRRVFKRLTALENLQMGAFSRRKEHTIKEDMERVFGLFPILAERRRQEAGTLSGGEQQMLAIGRALMARPKILLLDEPSLGLAPLMVEKIFAVLLRIQSEGAGILLVEQNAGWALSVSSWAYVMETGKIVLEGKGPELLTNSQVRQAYLGE